MKINIQLNKNGLYDINIKVANISKSIYDASEFKIRRDIENEELITLLLKQIKAMTELQMKSISFEKKIKFI